MADSAVVQVWSDIHCPWAFVAVHRLRRARDELGLAVTFDQRAWPLEWVNGKGTPQHIVPPETAVLSAHEPEIFNAYRNRSWPSTFLPAFELVAAARRVGGPAAAEEVDHALRLAFFRDGVDVSIEAGLVEALALAADRLAGAADAVLETWRTEPVRADVRADYLRSKELPIQGSPQVFWPDGTTDHNPGMTDHEWVGGIPRLHSTDPDAPARLLAAKLG